MAGSGGLVLCFLIRFVCCLGFNYPVVCLFSGQCFWLVGASNGFESTKNRELDLRIN